MAVITSYSTLQSELKDVFAKSADTSSPWTRFIDDAENALRRDPRVRRRVKTTFSVDAEEETLPTDFVELVSLVHDGSGDEWGAISIVEPNFLPTIKLRTSTTSGVPVAASIVDATTIRFAPVPDDTYVLDMVYIQTIKHLGGAVLSNWLLDDHPDLYLEACTIEAAKYFKDPERLQVARAELDRKLEELHMNEWRGQWGGSMRRQLSNPIG